MDEADEIDEIEAQVAALLEKKARLAAAAERKRAEQERAERNVLVPDSPQSTRTANRKCDEQFKSGKSSKEFVDKQKSRPTPSKPTAAPDPRAASVSQFLDGLKNLGKGKDKKRAAPRDKDAELLQQLSAASTSRPRVDNDDDDEELEVTDKPRKTRHRDGTIIEDLVIGPKDFKAPKGDPNFDTLEPYSQIHLKPGTRETTHEDLQVIMDQRAALTPQLVYSLARGAYQKGGALDLACENEFVVFGVLAWKDEVRFTRADALKDESNIKRKPWDHSRPDVKEEDKDELFRAPTKRQKQKKYIRFHLVDMSTPEASAAGHAQCDMMLFEADTEEEVEEDDGYRRKIYSGGSFGLFEKLWKVSPGTVVAVLGPRVSKYQPPPGQPGNGTITLTPESNAEVHVIGMARDWGTCQAIKRDGKQCTDWRDVRHRSLYCSFHRQTQIKRVGARRAETFSAQSNTHKTVHYSGSQFTDSLKNGHKKVIKPDPGRAKPPTAFDPATKTGLLPDDRVRLLGGEMTYCVPAPRVGKYIHSSDARRAAAIESGNGSGGYIAHIRDGPTVAEAEKKLRDELEGSKRGKKDRDDLLALDEGTTIGGAYLLAKRKRERANDSPSSDSDASSDTSDQNNRKRKKAFSGGDIAKIGFDPTAAGSRTRDESPRSRKKRMGEISKLALTEREGAKLSAPRGKAKVRSGVVPPPRNDVPQVRHEAQEREDDEDLPDLAGVDSRAFFQQEAAVDDEDDLLIEGMP